MQNLKRIREAIFDGNPTAAKVVAQQIVEAKVEASAVFKEAIIPAIRDIGVSMEEGDFFMPEVKTATKALLEVSEVLKSYVLSGGASAYQAPPWTGEGDIDDIGSYLKRIGDDGMNLSAVQQMGVLEMVAKGLNTHEFTPCKIQDKETRK
jgi:methanogenic corrinoid protein MtbC1